jgi:hypothetical protein
MPKSPRCHGNQFNMMNSQLGLIEQGAIWEFQDLDSSVVVTGAASGVG